MTTLIRPDQDFNGLQRRSFLALAASGMLAPMTATGRDAPVFDGALISAAAIGAILVQSGYVADDVEAVKDQLADRVSHVAPAGTDMLVNSLLATSRHDFEIGDTVRVEGVLLGKTEMLAYSLIHLMIRESAAV